MNPKAWQAAVPRLSKLLCSQRRLWAGWSTGSRSGSCQHVGTALASELQGRWGRKGTLKASTTPYLELWRKVFSTHMEHKDHDPSKTAKIWRLVTSVTGKGTGPDGGKKFRHLRRLGGRACMCLPHAWEMAAAPPNGGGETSKDSYSFFKIKRNIGFMGKE